MTTATLTRSTVETATWTRTAPQLRPVAEALWATHEDPDDRAAKIRWRLLQKAGVHLCPRCGTAFSVADWARTETGFSHREVLGCRGCHAEYVLDEGFVA